MVQLIAERPDMAKFISILQHLAMRAGSYCSAISGKSLIVYPRSIIKESHTLRLG